MECEMTSLNAKLAISALGMMITVASPAFAQKVHRYSSPQHATTSDPIDPNGRGIYNMVAPLDPSGRDIYNVVPIPDSPAVTGGGSAGYNRNLRDNKW
jgi:hypothetical protein